MSSKTIALVGALDTKGAEADFIAGIICQRGHRALLIDVGVLADPQVNVDVSSREIAHAGGVARLIRSGMAICLPVVSPAYRCGAYASAMARSFCKNACSLSSMSDSAPFMSARTACCT